MLVSWYAWTQRSRHSSTSIGISPSMTRPRQPSTLRLRHILCTIWSNHPITSSTPLTLILFQSIMNSKPQWSIVPHLLSIASSIQRIWAKCWRALHWSKWLSSESKYKSARLPKSLASLGGTERGGLSTPVDVSSKSKCEPPRLLKSAVVLDFSAPMDMSVGEGPSEMKTSLSVDCLNKCISSCRLLTRTKSGWAG